VHSETGESTFEETNVFNVYWSRTPPNFVRAGRENIVVGLPWCVDEAKDASTTHDAFEFLISDNILNIILLHTNQKGGMR
jgi:hypothetical protein